MARRSGAARTGGATYTVPVTRAQLEFLVEGDLTRLAAVRGRPLDDATAETIEIAGAELQALVTAWAATFGGDRRPGVDCRILTWTPALAAVAVRRTQAAEALTERTMALTDYLAFGRAVPLRRLLAAVVLEGDSSDERGRHPAPNTPMPDPEVTRLTTELQRAGATYDAADAEYRDAVRRSVAAAPGATPPNMRQSAATSITGSDSAGGAVSPRR